MFDYILNIRVEYTDSSNQFCKLRVLKCRITRLEIGDAHWANNQNKEFQPIFYNGTTFANYEEAKHVLSFNNCVLMDDLFQNQSTKANSDALRAE